MTTESMETAAKDGPHDGEIYMYTGRSYIDNNMNHFYASPYNKAKNIYSPRKQTIESPNETENDLPVIGLRKDTCKRTQPDSPDDGNPSIPTIDEKLLHEFEEQMSFNKRLNSITVESDDINDINFDKIVQNSTTGGLFDLNSGKLEIIVDSNADLLSLSAESKSSNSLSSGMLTPRDKQAKAKYNGKRRNSRRRKSSVKRQDVNELPKTNVKVEVVKDLRVYRPNEKTGKLPKLFEERGSLPPIVERYTLINKNYKRVRVAEDINEKLARRWRSMANRTRPDKHVYKTFTEVVYAVKHHMDRYERDLRNLRNMSRVHLGQM